MNCRSSRDSIIRYFDGLLDKKADTQLKSHLKTCPKCRHEFYAMDKFFKEMPRSQAQSPPAGFETDVMNRIARIENKKRERKGFLIAALYNCGALIFIAGITLFTACPEALIPGVGFTSVLLSGTLEFAGRMISLAVRMTVIITNAGRALADSYFHVIFGIAAVFVLLYDTLKNTMRKYGREGAG